MAVRDEDRIDFDKLEQELNNAVEEDKKYWQKNDAKFRAVEQRVATYEEFRDIVQAAHLRPLEKDDKFNNEKFTQPWNINATKNTEKVKVDCKEITKSDGKVPKNGHEFARDWRRFYKSQEERLGFLLNLGGDNIRNIFKTEISMGLLGEIIDSLSAIGEDHDVKDVLDILDALSSANRFQLSLSFLSKKERDLCEQLFEKLTERRKSCNDLSEDRLNAVKKKYCS